MTQTRFKLWYIDGKGSSEIIRSHKLLSPIYLRLCQDFFSFGRFIEESGFQWSEQVEEAFKALKIIMTSAPMLSLPDSICPSSRGVMLAVIARGTMIPEGEACCLSMLRDIRVC